MQDFKKLTVWQKSHRLTLGVFQATHGFPYREQFGLSQQLRKSEVSVESNIAEGSGRGRDTEFTRFSYIALGSACELECQLLIARDLGMLGKETFDVLDALCAETRKMLWALIQRLESHA